MALTDSRRRLDEALKKEMFGAVSQAWAAELELINAWWTDLKAEERDDKFYPIFHESRMIIRYVKQGVDAVVDMQAQRGQSGKPQTFEQPRRDLTGLSGVKLMAAKAEAPKLHKLGLGVKQLAQRLEPANFMPRAGAKRKIEFGLYDMSASLLKPNDTISAQIFNQPKNGDIYCFMPIAREADQQTFYDLNEAGKRLRTANTALYDRVREIRSKLTRIVLACEHDMATNFSASRPDNPVNPKFRYGWGAQTKVPDPQKPDSLILVANTQKLIDDRRKAAINYTGILRNTIHRYNEITVAFRHHDGEFPIFGIWDGARFKVSRLQGERLAPTGKFIENTPTNT